MNTFMIKLKQYLHILYNGNAKKAALFIIPRWIIFQRCVLFVRMKSKTSAAYCQWCVNTHTLHRI